MASQYNLLEGLALKSESIVQQASVEGTVLGSVTATHGKGRDTFDMDLMRKCMHKNMFNFLAFKHYLLPKELPVHLTCGELAISKLETTRYKDISDIDSKCMRPTIEHLIEVRRFTENENLLTKTKQKVQDMRKELDAQWNRLAHDENELKLNFIRFNKFVKENLDKRERAAKKYVYEQDMKLKKEKDVEELIVNLQKVRKMKVVLEKTIKSHRIYEEYLSSVTTYPAAQGTFKTIDDIINRYDTMMETKRNLASLQEQKLAELETSRQLLAQTVKHYKLIILGLTTRCCDLMQHFKRLWAETLTKEKIVERIKDANIAQLRQIVLAKLSIENMYYLMCDRRLITPRERPNDFEHHLDFIKAMFLESVKTKKTVRKNLDSQGSRSRMESI